MKAKRLSKAQRSDLITTLPQAIIETILCLLPIEEAARTSILSREWRYKWTTIPKLVFSRSSVKKSTEEKQRERRKKDLSPYGVPFYGLPLYILPWRHLTDLHLASCVLDHQPIFNGISSLTTLSLKGVTMSIETLLHLLSNCPSLKSLCLIINNEDLLDNENPSIVELFKCLPMIENLTTWGYIIPSFVQASVPEEPPTLLIHLKYIYIDYMCFVDGYGMPFLAVLLKCSPNLEKIKLEIREYYELEEHSLILEEYSDVWLEHLNELKIQNFRNRKPEMEFVKFIMGRSPNLKKVVLRICMFKNEELEMSRILLRAPRVSPVEIIVHNSLIEN
ncbi:putative FBD domain, leucine-rich repeat domain superfamily, F-box-like domain superfamily [Helianthus debilis subsp. tardiflorus]